METTIQIFTSDIFGEIRTCQVNNQIMFVGKDVATALGYAKPQNALATHVDKDDKSTAPIQGTAYETRVTLINESGLYSLILSSKLPQAKAFKRWVTAEVLPQIRCSFSVCPYLIACYALLHSKVHASLPFYTCLTSGRLL
jgi:Prophage antirepressor